LKNTTLKTKNRAGQAFRMAAQSVKQAECAFGVLYRRLRARLGPAQATVATAHAIARVVCRMLKYKVEYDPLSVNEYQKQYEEQQIKYMKKRAAKLGSWTIFIFPNEFIKVAMGDNPLSVANRIAK
jgi:hypothetical protein